MAEDEDDDDDEIKRLECISTEIKVRDDDETNRQKTADSKLTSALAVLPIIVTLASTAFFQLLPYASALGCIGVGLVFAFFLAIVLFVTSASVAIVGLWPMRATYAAIGLKTLSDYVDSGTYAELLRKVIDERKNAVRINGRINGGKLGLYAQAARLTIIGLIVLTCVVLAVSIAFVVAPDRTLTRVGWQRSNLQPQIQGVAYCGGNIDVDLWAGRAGVTIHLVYPKGSGENAGLRQRDRIVSIDNQDIESASDAVALISRAPVNSTLAVLIVRNGRKHIFYPTVVASSCH